ncbi:MAG: ECF-type sigma factor, partial [Planctomycetota bacterium]
SGDAGWENRRHFFAAAAEAMRRILVDRARRKKSRKRGGGMKGVPLDDATLTIDAPSDDIIALDEALQKLAEEDKQKAELVKLRYFAGLTNEQAAKALDISATTAKRHWQYARVWLLRRIDAGQP